MTAQTCLEWLFDEKGERVSELEAYLASGFDLSENSSIEAGMKFLRLLSEFYGERTEFAEFSERICVQMSQDLSRILMQCGIDPAGADVSLGGLFQTDFQAVQNAELGAPDLGKIWVRF